MNPLVALPAEKVAVNPELARALKYAVALYVGVTVQAGVFVYAVAKVTVHAVGEPLPIWLAIYTAARGPGALVAVCESACIPF